MDIEKQKDEIMALESIYNGEEFSYCTVDDHYEITFKIFVSLPENYFFTYNDNPKETDEVRKVQVSHLPPLVLCVELPKDYPSVSPPKFVLRSSWLKVNGMQKLCKELDRLWKTCEGQEILFTWISFLQSETLQFLRIEESVNVNFAYSTYKKRLGKAQMKQETASSISNATSAKEDCKSKMEKVEDKKEILNPQRAERKQSLRKKFQKSCKKNRNCEKRAVSDFINTNPVKMLIDYNKMRNEIEFRKSFYLCKICFTDKVGEHCIQFSPCMHVFCKECIAGYFESKIKDGTVQNIRCPDDGCISEALPNQVKEIVSSEMFSHYDTLLLNTTLDTMTDIVYCPRQICQYPVSKEQNELMASCPMCEYTFCILCKAVYHGIEPCKANSVEKQNLIKEYQEANDKKKIEMEKKYGKKQMQTLLDNAMSENWIEKNSQNCPKCNAAIEKTDGCNKMTCWKCNVFFCWLCKTRLLNSNPYDHYIDPQSECYRRLFQGATLTDDDTDDESDFDDDFEDEDYDDFNYIPNFSDSDEDDDYVLYHM